MSLELTFLFIFYIHSVYALGPKASKRIRSQGQLLYTVTDSVHVQCNLIMCHYGKSQERGIEVTYF